ncbi:MAG: cytochrome P450 [Chloroflexi bacterium]|nr:cytochrome P450 [Chloroflexota bacterium]
MIPGPKHHLVTGILPEYRRDPLGFFTTCAREYGDIVALRAGHRRGVMLNRPEYIEAALATHGRSFIKGFGLRRNRLLLGNGLLSSSGEFWVRQRRLAQPAFHRKRIAEYGGMMAACAEAMVATWRDGEVRDVHAEMMRLALQIASRALFGVDLAGEASRMSAALTAAREGFAARLGAAFPLPERVPTPRNLRIQRAVRELDAIIYRLISQRRTEGAETDDLLSTLIRARDEDGSRMTDRQLRDEVMTFALAGHETTALALTWALYLVSTHEQVEDRLLAEIERVLGGRSPCVGDRPWLVSAERVVMEAMRLYPPAWGMLREAAQDCSIGGYRLRKGATVAISQWVMHRDPRYFEEPEAFRPERWTPEAERRLPKYAYFPFGGGPRRCIGEPFALLEATLVLAAVAQRVHLSPVPGHPVVPRPTTTLQPAHGVRMIVHRR